MTTNAGERHDPQTFDRDEMTGFLRSTVLDFAPDIIRFLDQKADLHWVDDGTPSTGSTLDYASFHKDHVASARLLLASTHGLSNLRLKPYRDYQGRRLITRRLHGLRALVATGLVVQLAVFWYLQIVRGPEYHALAEENRLHRRIERALRGPLADRRGEVLATNRPAFAVLLDPNRTRDPRAEVARLARTLSPLYGARPLFPAGHSGFFT